MSTPFASIPLNGSYGHSGAVLGDQIRREIVRLREQRGWSRADLAKRVSPPTSSQQIERLEKGQRQLDTGWIEKIAKALHVDPVQLVAGEEQLFEFSPQVADEIAEHLARVVLQGDEPTPGIVQDLSTILQEMSATFARHPQARRDPLMARPVVDLLTHRRARQ
jgi:transcriptional regulator with XRE-family HTH domain